MSSDLEQLKHEINETKLLLEALLEYSEIPTSIVNLTISKTDRLKNLLLQLTEKKAQIAPQPNASPVVEPLVKKVEPEVEPVPQPEVVEKEPINEEEPVVEDLEPEVPEVKEQVIEEVPELKEIDEQEEEEPVVEVQEIKTPEPVQTIEEEPMVVEAIKEEVEEVYEEVEKPEVIEIKEPAKNVLGETLNRGRSVMNDTIQTNQNTIGSRVGSVPIKDLKGAIPINDRFRYQRDLFNNDVMEFNKTLSALNDMPELGEAIRFIEQKYDWDQEHQTVIDFVNLLRRKFVN